jgi:hypothetical protein
MSRLRLSIVTIIFVLCLRFVNANNQGGGIPPDWAPRVEGGKVLFNTLFN